MAEQRETKVTEVRSEPGLNGDMRQEQIQSTTSTADGKTTAANVVWYIFGLIGILLAMRFVLKLFGANPNNGFVDMIYGVSGVLSAPFDNIFGVEVAEAGQTQSVFEPSILVAIAVYALLAWGIAKLLRINEVK